IFAVHPVATEAVANVVGQAELLAALGIVGACVLYGRRPEGRLGAGRIAAIVACYLVGLASKENAVVLPALLVALDLATGRLPARGLAFRASALRVLPLYLALCGAALLYFAVRFVVLDSAVGTITPSLPFRDDAGVRILTAFRCWIEYARLLFFPVVLSTDYSPAVILPASSWTPLVIIGAALLGGLMLLGTRIRTRPEAGLPALWFLITILPVSNLIFPAAFLVAERTLYTPAVSVAMVAAFLLSAAIRFAPTPVARRLAFAAATIVVVAFGARTITRNPEWKSSATIMAALMRDHPESYVAQWRTALEAADQGKDAAAADHFELAYRIWPHNAHLLINYAEFLLEHGEPGRAVHLLGQALAIGRGEERARQLLDVAEAARLVEAAGTDRARAAADRAASPVESGSP
ncbi:MAG: tetratricopeptide repeat protein, partial [Longimicrobiales bacterium]